MIDAVVLLIGAWTALAAEMPRADLTQLRDASVPTDGAALLAWLRPRLPAAGDTERLADLVRQLGDRSFPVRDRATSELIALGPKACPALRLALHDPSAEVRNRAQHCLRITATLTRVWPNIVVRLQEEHPPGTTAALLDLLPLADEDTEDAIHVALSSLGRQGGRIPLAVRAALADENASKRAAAALAVGRARPADACALLHPLLKDPEPKVRLYAALGLLLGGDRAALATLPEMVEVPALADQTEAMLEALAVMEVPAVAAAKTPAERRKAWAAFCRERGASLDLTPVPEFLPGQNIAVRAKRVAEQFIAAWQRSNGRALTELSSTPFWSAGQLLATPADLSRAWGAGPGGNNAYHFRFHQLLSTSGAVPFCHGPAEINFVKSLRAAEHRVMVYSPTANSWGLLVIRRSGGRVTIAGLTVDRGGDPPK